MAMRTRVLLACALCLACALVAVLAQAMLTEGDSVFSWKRPQNLGLRDGRLAPPSRTPNCVSSQADPADAEHYVAPIAFPGGTPEAMAAVRRAVASMQGATVVREDAGYLYAEYRTRWMRFVDDVEFAHDAKAGVIHVRSASRLGRRDFGVNRARVEALRARIAAG